MQQDNSFQSTRQETLITLAVTGVTLVLIGLAGYHAPSLLAFVAR